MRWLCDLVGYGEGSFGLLASGGVMANFIALALVRDVHLPGADAARARPPRGAALEGVRVYASRPGPLLDRPGARRAGLPARDAGPRPGRRRDSASTPRRSPRPSRATGPRACGRSRSPPSRARRTRAPSTCVAGARRRWPQREGLWLHVDAAYGGAARLSARDADRVPGLDLADSVTVDPHKWFFQAYDVGGAARPRRAAPARRRSIASPEYYRGGEATRRRRSGRRPRRRPRRPRRPAQLLQARLRGHAPLAGAQAVGCPGSTSARAASAGSSSATTTSPPTSPPRCAEADDFEALPERARAVASSASATCPAAPRPPTDGTRATSTPTRTASQTALEAVGRRLALDDLAARLDLAARRDRQLPAPTEADIDRLLATLRRLA